MITALMVLPLSCESTMAQTPPAKILCGKAVCTTATDRALVTVTQQDKQGNDVLTGGQAKLTFSRIALPQGFPPIVFGASLADTTVFGATFHETRQSVLNNNITERIYQGIAHSHDGGWLIMITAVPKEGITGEALHEALSDTHINRILESLTIKE